MKCPRCGKIEDRVLDSRESSAGDYVRRRRECSACGMRFTSYERAESAPLKVVKKNNRREEFDVEKMRKGIGASLKKRPVGGVEIDRMLAEIEAEARAEAGKKAEIESVKLGEMILTRLYNLDKVACVRFASVYRDFKNIEEFVEMIKGMKEREEK